MSAGYLRTKLLSDENIYLAIYKMESYIDNQHLLNDEDKRKYNLLKDKFSIEYFEKTSDKDKNIIDEIKDIIEEIIDNEDRYFKCKICLKPKKITEGKIDFRIIHYSNLIELIAMVAMLQVIIYDFHEDETGKIRQSNYEYLIPDYFYGNILSEKTEELFKPWSNQYKKYISTANEKLNMYKNNNLCKYEVALDFKNFFPSINPQYVLDIIISNCPDYFEEEDNELLKIITKKLIKLEIENIEKDQDEEVIEKYYGKDTDLENFTDRFFTIGIPQGLPQSYFFANLVMTKIDYAIKETFSDNNKYNCDAIYYVDDIYLYTDNENLDREKNKKGIINKLEKRIKEELDEEKTDDGTFDNIVKYSIKIHPYLNKDESTDESTIDKTSKTSINKISSKTPFELKLGILSREVSNISKGIYSSFSNEELLLMSQKIEEILSLIKSEENKKRDNNYKIKLSSIHKFLKYRKLKIDLQIESKMPQYCVEMFSLEDIPKNPSDEKYYDLSSDKDLNNLLNKINNIDFEEKESGAEKKEKFIEYYTKDILDIMINKLFSISKHKKTNLEKLKEYYKKLTRFIYENINEKFYYMKIPANIIYEEKNIKYKSIKKLVYDRISYAYLISTNKEKILKKKDIVEKYIKDINESLNDKHYKIVNNNTDELKRMILNAYFSIGFGVDVSDSFSIMFDSRKMLTYNRLRILLFLRKRDFSVRPFLNKFSIVLNESEDTIIDMSILEVLPIFKYFINDSDQIDDLVLVHKYVCALWKNGSKHLYFYTLHNQEHAIVLIKNIVKIIKAIPFLHVSSYNYYLVFMSCYLHDIAMTNIASDDSFIKSMEFERIKEYLYENKENLDADQILKIYHIIDDFFEKEIRNNHAENSANQIREDSNLNFLDNSTRENIAQISKGHGEDVNTVYYKKDNNNLISMKKDKILLRLADLLDISKERVSKILLNKTYNIMSDTSAFHWVSHLLTQDYDLELSYDQGEKEGELIENIIFKVYINFPYQNIQQKSKECCVVKDTEIKSYNETILKIKNESADKCDHCNLRCSWFTKKNQYLINELKVLQEYVNKLKEDYSFYENINIKIKIISSNEGIPKEYIDIIKKQIEIDWEK